MAVINTTCTKTKDEATLRHLNNANVQEINSPLLELGSDTEFDSSDAYKYLHINIDENNQPRSPSILDSKPYRRKRLKQPRLAFYPVKNNYANASVTENSATTLVNSISEISEDDVIEVSPTQCVMSKVSKFKQWLKLKRKTAKHIDFGSCPSPKHTSTQMENVNIESTLKDKINISYLSPIKMHNNRPISKTDIKDETFYLPANINEMDNFNLDDTENKPPEKKMLLNKFNVWSKRKDMSEQLNMRRKAGRAKLKGWDCWECREYYNNLSLSKEELQKRKNQCSRHRRKYERPNTPEGFWDPEFPETLSSTY